MDASVYQNIYVVLFVLAGVFLMLSIVFFFAFDVRSVIKSLYGKNERDMRSDNPANTTGNRQSTEKQGRKTALLRESGTVLLDEDATSVTRFLENMMLEPDDESDTEATTAELFESGRSDDAAGRQHQWFRPEIKILECSARDSID